MREPTAIFRRSLHSAEPPLPDDFSVACAEQRIPRRLLAEVDTFIELFDRVTCRRLWIDKAAEGVPPSARAGRSEVCFFSAWDFHLPPGRPDDWQLIEFNDNGSGFLFAAQINHIYYKTFLGGDSEIVPPPPFGDLEHRVQEMIAGETCHLLGSDNPHGVLILDDEDSLRSGHFRAEHQWLAALCRARGWRTQIAAPQALEWRGEKLLAGGEPFAFVINRSTDFLWTSDAFTALRRAFDSGRVYIAPNPFSFSTRSDKRLLEWLSRPDWDRELGITSEERALLSRRVPETRLLREDNVELLAQQKSELVFKPTQGHAGLGVLDSREVGRHRLRRLVAKGERYVAQRRVERSQVREIDGNHLWADLRVWCWRGRRYEISGRASRSADSLDLQAPGGWLPTFEVF
ncbi:hypothetical protein [Microbulbifer hainanensis]|uniref:hypothetical protein n=1 Tax=Microbulbifer hainanensis TaxID=2735675 RepID=UPI00186792A3|nr:hypothetical protein [Microbulbifer hainanensis]